MHYPSLSDFIASGRLKESRRPLALVFVEDGVEVASTLRHHLKIGFAQVVALMPPLFELEPELAETVCRIDYDVSATDALLKGVNTVIAAVPERWVFYCFNAEYLFFPFCETRSIGELVAFHSEERRASMLTYVIDLYADDLGRYPDAVSLENAYLDQSGYYAEARRTSAGAASTKERQLDFFGGLRWRFEEHIPATRRRIDRISLFQARRGLALSETHTFNDEEYNTYACPWHHNLTAAVCSFRTAKALKRNAGSTFDIPTFMWRNSKKFEWNSQQLLDFGLIETGQWF